MEHISQEILSDIIVFNKYAKYLPKLKRRETWPEIVQRYIDMMVKKYPDLTDDIYDHAHFILNKKVLPSMRALQFAGVAIEKNQARVYNCCYLPIDDHLAFSETMFLLLGGTGVGYSVQKHHVSRLPAIQKPTKEKKYLIGDSIEGWADAVKALMKSYFGLIATEPRFDFSDIRQKGERLITAGGKAPGPEPLRICLTHIKAILNSKKEGQHLTPLECHDILCHIADAVLAGGIRRAAMISLFSLDDHEMIACKAGAWYELNEQRGRANNSAVLSRDDISEEQFKTLWERIELSNAGEPGFYFTNNKEWGTNPCAEIALKPFQFCNLSEVNVSNVESQQDLNERVAAAAFFGTLQAGFTDFHYLRDVWRKTTELDALIGVGMTGIASGEILQYDLSFAAQISKTVNSTIASRIGINPASRCATVKPSGTTSLVLGTSSGIHAWHSNHYIRRMRLSKEEALYKYLIKELPQLLEDDVFKPTIQAVLSIPQKSPKEAITRTETALDLLQRVQKFNAEWVRVGHNNGDNMNNVSATISIDKARNYVKTDDSLVFEQMGEKPGSLAYNEGRFPVIDEWQAVGEWMWEHRNTFNGLSVMPADNGSYVQAPFTDCTEEEFENLQQHLHLIDLTKVVEDEDITSFNQEAACAGAACEI